MIALLFTLWVMLIVTPRATALAGGILRNHYLLPDSPKKVVKRISVYPQGTRYKDGSMLSLAVIVGSNIPRRDYEDYCLISYIRQSGASEFSLFKGGSGYCLEISPEGRAYLNSVKIGKIDQENELVFAVERKVDRSWLEYLLNGRPFPSSLQVIDETTLGDAFIYWVRDWEINPASYGGD